MATTTITKKELNVPSNLIIEVADVLLENGISNDIIGTDEETDELILEVTYEKEQREAIHQIEDLIADYEDNSEEEDEEEEE